MDPMGYGNIWAQDLELYQSPWCRESIGMAPHPQKNWMSSCSRRDRWPVRFVTFCAFCLYMGYIYIWGGVGWGYQRPDDYVLNSTSWRLRPSYYVVNIYVLLRMQHVTTLTLRWGGVGWGYQRPDDYVLDSMSWRLRPWYYVVNNMFSWGCNMLLYVDTTLGWVGWGGVEWRYQRPDDYVLDSTSWRLRPWYYVVNNMFSWGCNMLLYVDTTLGWVGWGGVGWRYQRPDDYVLDSTSWRLRPWYYVVNIYVILKMQHVTMSL